MLIQKFKAELRGNGYLGDFHNDYPTRLLNATDNSIYEVMPVAVTQPKSFDDLYILIKVSNLEIFKSLSFTARGGGTGTNGQSLSNSIVVDLSRYMTNILEFNPEEMTITVEPGIILSDLNRFLKPYGLFFAPNVSTENRATIGGMIATDAAGKGSLIYGKTIDSLVSLKVVLADGYILDTASINIDQIDNLDKNDRLFNIYSNLLKWLTPVQQEIDKRFPVLKRPLSGYNIKRCYKEDKLDLTALFAGSEGTLGIVASAKLKLLPIPKYKTLVVVHYPDFITALKDAENLIKYNPLAIEAVDEKVQKSAQTLPNWPILAKLLNSENKNYISNFVEFVANDSDSLNKTVSLLEQELIQKNANYVVIKDDLQISQLWSIRSLAVGLVGKIPGTRKPIAFVEDAIVPPEHLADFVSDLQIALEKENLQYAMYGHVDVGCIHVRPALDLQKQDDRQRIRPITEIVIKLLEKYNGILWGEHGKGFRGEFVPQVFGTILYPILCQIKQLFDPYNRLNPGKLAAPSETIPLDRIEQIPMRGQFDEIIDTQLQQEYESSMLCNGNAACFNQEPTNIMCPSYKVTKDRIHSPKGRAMLIKQWLRELSKPHGNDKQLANMAFDALNGCLSCKGCSGKCPTQVSIPDLKTKFLNDYYSKYKKRTLRDLSLGYIEHLLPIIAKVPRTWNLFRKTKIYSILGLSDIPKFDSYVSLSKILKGVDVREYSSLTQVEDMPENSVTVFIDVFTGYLNKEVLVDSIKVLKSMGYIPYVIYPKPSGKSLIVGGFIKEFKNNTKNLSELFEPLFDKSIPIIGLENSITLMFRQEVSKFATKFSGKVLTIAEFINQNIHHVKLNNQENVKKEYCLLPHCTEQAVLPGEAQLWKNVFNSLNLTLTIQNTGCCGMAGSYGYQLEHQQNSKDLFAMHWQQYIENSEINVLATGFSCRSQSQRLVNRKIAHPIQIIARHFQI